MFSATSRRTMNMSQPMVLSPKPNYFMSNRVVHTQPQQPKSQSIPVPVPVIVPRAINKPKPPEPGKPKSMKWGEPVWFFLHTLAHKVKDESFFALRGDILKHIYTICTNLPCPDCSGHAKNYLNGINFNNIRTKTDLKNMLFEFHNSVNRRKGFVEFPKEELDRKYDSANFNAIVNYFVHVFLDRHASPRMISDDMYRARLTQIIKQWISDNLIHFNP